MHSWIFLSTFDASLDGLHIYLELASAALLGVGRQGGFSSHSVYTRIMARLSSDHWVCLFLQDWFPSPWPFGKNLRTPLHSRGLFFLVFFVWHFSWGGSKVISKIYILTIYARAAEVLPSAQSPWRSPLLLSVRQPCPNWAVSWVVRYIFRVPLMVQCLRRFLDKNTFWLQAAYWEVCYMTYFLLLSWWIRFRRVDSLLFDRICGVSTFPHVMWVGEDKMEVIE